MKLELIHVLVTLPLPVGTAMVFPAGPACGEACASTTVVPVEVAMICAVQMPLVVVQVVEVTPPVKVEPAAVLAASMLNVTTSVGRVDEGACAVVDLDGRGDGLGAAPGDVRVVAQRERDLRVTTSW